MDHTLRIQIIEEIEAALDGGPSVAVATVTAAGDPPFLAPGAKLLVRRDGTVAGALAPGAIDEAVTTAARAAFEAFPRVLTQTLLVGANGALVTRRSRAQPGDAEVMLQLYEAPARLVIVGGGHIGLALAQVGELLGYEILVFDDREAFANRDRFPMAQAVHAGDIAAMLRELPLDAQTFVVLVSRGHLLDEAALRATVGRGATYIGMIGSRRRTSIVLQRLEESGVDPAALDDVATPIGLDIGAETPEEIAVAIFAEITMLRRGGNGGRMISRSAKTSN